MNWTPDSKEHRDIAKLWEDPGAFATALVAILVEIVKRPWKHPLSSAGHRIDWHRIAHLGCHG